MNCSPDISMTPSTRLWNRLRDIPSSPNESECVKEVVIVAFGAFERYYVCWKNQNGKHKQGMFPIVYTVFYIHYKRTCPEQAADSYGLPQELKQWLFPPDGSTRDSDTLQIVFGRGDEYFASDKNEKVTNMEMNAELRDKLSGKRGTIRLNRRSDTHIPSPWAACPPIGIWSLLSFLPYLHQREFCREEARCVQHVRRASLSTERVSGAGWKRKRRGRVFKTITGTILSTQLL